VKSIKITEVYEKSTRRQTFRDFCKFHPAMDHTFDKSKVNQVQTRYATRLRYALRYRDPSRPSRPTEDGYLLLLLSCKSSRSKLALQSAWLGQLRSRSRQIWGSKVNR
jgi:hypothetical protein